MTRENKEQAKKRRESLEERIQVALKTGVRVGIDAERERCAQIASNMCWPEEVGATAHELAGFDRACEMIAAEIRRK